MKKKKLLLFSVIGVVAVTLVILNLTLDKEKAVLVASDTATRNRLVETVTASGRIQPQTKVDITSEVNGEIIGLYAREGSPVKVGELLVVLDTVRLRSDVDQARYAVSEVSARMTGFRAGLDQAEEQYQRQQQLFKNNLTSETELDKAKYAHLNAQSLYEASKAQSRQLESRYQKQLDFLSKAKIVAPMSGIVTFLDCEVGEIAAAQTAFTQGKRLMTISDLSVFEVEVEVDETEINKIKLGQLTSIEVDAFPDTTFPGEVVKIGNTAVLSRAGTQDQSTNFSVKVIFQDPNVKIRPGMSATVEITSAESEDALTIPYSAVVMRSYDLDSLERARQGDAEAGSTAVGEVQAAESDSDEVVETADDTERKDIKGVFVISDGKVRFVAIETGIADRKRIEVTSGLTKGDSVVAGPYRALRTIKDGDEVKIKNDDEKKSD